MYSFNHPCTGEFMFKRTQISTCALLALGGVLMVPAVPAYAQTQTIEVTGSRIKRADAEGALPVTVIQREELEASGQTTVAEFVRTTTFTSFGNFRPQSGSSAQGFSEANLRGLGSRRTLVLVDGRRVAKDPQVGSAVDMNSIPLAAVERIEILTDGASAVYGSDAIGGVINVILRKDFDGGAISLGETATDVKGGDRKEMSAIFGTTSDKGRLVMGASSSSREIVFQRDSLLGVTPGASSFSNNFFTTPGLGGYLGEAGGAGNCNTIGRGFYTAGGRCRYDFTSVAADEAAVSSKSIFARGETKISSDWSAYMTGSVSRTKTFGRYAPVPGVVTIEPGTAGDLLGRSTTYYLAHRFAAGGNRDTSTDRNLYDVMLGAQGRAGGFDLDFGARRTVSQFYEIGRGFIVETLARQAIADGLYNILDPFNADPLVLASFTATVGRDGLWDQTEVYGSATKSLFKLGGGDAMFNVQIEHREEKYRDIYDSLSEGGVVLGSAGSSAGGSRRVIALGGELLMPITKQLEATLSARFEKYSDYGSDFSPKLSLRYQPTRNLTLRTSFGEGFAAPTLPQLTQKPAFSADSIIDRAHCLADGNPVSVCDRASPPSFQINGTQISNPSLSSEKSKQFAMGGVWDVTPNVSLEATYWNTKIDGVIVDVSAQTIVNRNNGTSSLPIPPGLSITRDSTGFITSVIRGSTNEGELKVSGIDLSANFSHKWANAGAFRHILRLSNVQKYAINGSDVVGTFGAPKDRVTLSNNWNNGPLSATWNVNLIGKHGDDQVGYVGSYVTHDVQVAFQTPIKGVKLVAGAVNAHGKLPQRVSDDTRQFDFDLYDAYGKQLYGRLEAKF
jgi:iron complex outermembrane recepter protein